MVFMINRWHQETPTLFKTVISHMNVITKTTGMLPYNGYFSRGNIFVKVVILAISWKKFRGRAVCLLLWARARGVFRG